jgi:hypothetical protein
VGNWLEDSGLVYDRGPADGYPAFSAASASVLRCIYCGKAQDGVIPGFCCARRRDHVGTVEDRRAIERLESRGYQVRKVGTVTRGAG